MAHTSNKQANKLPTNAITWFEIPATDLAKSQHFYEAVLACKMRREDAGPNTLAIFPYVEPGLGGCIHSGATALKPSQQGTLVYLDCSPSIDAALTRAAAAGGEIIAPKTALPAGMGFFAHILDTEGNRVGLHSLT